MNFLTEQLSAWIRAYSTLPYLQKEIISLAVIFIVLITLFVATVGLSVIFR